MSPERHVLDRVAERYRQGERVSDLSYETGLHDVRIYRAIAERAASSGINYRAENRRHRAQARRAQDDQLRERHRQGATPAQLARETGLGTADLQVRLSAPVAAPTPVSEPADDADRLIQLQARLSELLARAPETEADEAQSLARTPEEVAIIGSLWREHNLKRRVQRAERLAQMYCEGKTLEEVGALNGISRERVRQLIDRDLPGGMDRAVQSMRARRARIITERRSDLLSRARQWSAIHGAATVTELDEAMHPHKEDARWLHTQMRDRLVRTKISVPVFTDEQISAALQAAHHLNGGHLSSKDYEKVRQPDWPSLPLIVHRLGWNVAMTQAGLATVGANRSYQRRWQASDAAVWVRRFRQDIPGGNSIQYDSWQRQHAEAPSLATLSMLAGSWQQAVAMSLR